MADVFKDLEKEMKKTELYCRKLKDVIKKDKFYDNTSSGCEAYIPNEEEKWYARTGNRKIIKSCLSCEFSKWEEMNESETKRSV